MCIYVDVDLRKITHRLLNQAQITRGKLLDLLLIVWALPLGRLLSLWPLHLGSFLHLLFERRGQRLTKRIGNCLSFQGTQGEKGCSENEKIKTTFLDSIDFMLGFWCWDQCTLGPGVHRKTCFLRLSIIFFQDHEKNWCSMPRNQLFNAL